mgnify:FL=1
MSAKKVVSVTKRAADISKIEEIKEVQAAPIIEEPTPEEEPYIPHIEELFSMTFHDSNGELLGVRRSIKLGMLEIYEIRS